MFKPNSSSEDGNLNIAFFSVLTVSLFLLFAFSEGDAVPKEEERKIGILSSLEVEIVERAEKNDFSVYNESYFFPQSAPSYHNPKVFATKTDKKEIEVKDVAIKDDEENFKEEASATSQEEENVRKLWVKLTAYAPLDPMAQEGMCFSGNPAITASGTYSREGVVAANFLSFGTKIRIPSLFGDRIFTVEDRMSSRFNNTVDILVSSRQEAINFGSKSAYIEIVE